MGDIKKKRQAYSRPRQLFDRARIDQENILIKKYGLKNKKEIWKAKSLVSKFRRRAKDLISKDIEQQQQFFNKLNKLGLNITNISDVLALTENHLLDRRLQTFVNKKDLSNTSKQARQLITHKHVLVDGNIVNVPSFWITSDLEKKIEIKPQKEKPKIVKEEKEALEPTENKEESPTESESKETSKENKK
jgi:small subunit ribosomal protein S4